MKKRSVLVYIFLILGILASAYGIFYFIDKIENVDNLVYIPMVFMIVLLSVLISTIANQKYAKLKEISDNRLNMWNSITYKVRKAGETAFNELPIGIIVLDNNYKIMWANSNAKHLFMSGLEDISLKDIKLPLFNQLENTSPNEEGTITFETDIYGTIYQVEYLVSNNVMYVTNINDLVNLKKKYIDRTLAIGYINIDNLEEALADFDTQERAEYQAKIIGSIAKWSENFGAYARAYSDSRYMILMDNRQLEEMMKNNFSILDEIKEVLR